MNYIFLDANIYLKFYLGNKMLKSLDHLVNNKEYLIVTQQIVNEVLRNSVSSTAANLKNIDNSKDWKVPAIPYKHNNELLNNELSEIGLKIKNLKRNLESEFTNHLVQISKRTDEVSQKLDKLFQNAIAPTEREINEAKDVKAFGTPPGKKNDPIGDELSWIQLKNKLSINDKLILVTNDRDYATVYNNTAILNSKLKSELEEKQIDCFVFTELVHGIDKLKSLQDTVLPTLIGNDFPDQSEQVAISLEERIISIEKDPVECTHPRKYRMINGIFDEYRCEDCNSLLMRNYSDEID